MPSMPTQGSSRYSRSSSSRAIPARTESGTDQAALGSTRRFTSGSAERRARRIATSPWTSLVPLSLTALEAALGDDAAGVLGEGRGQVGGARLRGRRPG